jgi:PAP2 superfamily
MKRKLLVRTAGRARIMCFILLVVLAGFAGCRKEPGFNHTLPPTLYSSDVLDKWMTLQIRLMTNATGIFNGALTRPFVYAGISAYESLDPGVASLRHKLNGLSGLPETEIFKKYNWNASVNASQAEYNRMFFTSAYSKPVDIAAIDSLEAAINLDFTNLDAGVLNRSVAFGKAIADAIFAWGETDDYNANNALPYTPPVGPGLWVPTPPAFAKPQGPFWSNDRPIIAGSDDNAQPGPPTPYSEVPGSDFYNMVNDLYNASKVLTTDLDKSALTYAVVGICLNDAVISVFRTKYTYNLLRPITYIRNVIKDTSFLSFLTTPAHPEYPSAHSVASAAASEAMQSLYGNIGPFTDHTYDYLSIPARTFNTFRDIGTDAGNSRFYAGIHYQPSIDVGLKQGRIVGQNIMNALTHIDFRK